MLGASEGAVCKLVSDADVTTVLGVGEGIETMLSMQHLLECHRIPVWACCSVSRLGKFPVLDGIESLWIAVDYDDAGIEATERLADRWIKAGREVFLVKAKAAKHDINDLVRSRGNG